MKTAKILALSVFFIFSSACPMHRLSPVISEITLRKLLSVRTSSPFYKFCKTINWGLAAGPNFYGAYKSIRLDRTLQRKLDDADPVTIAFARKQCKKVGVKNPEEISVKKGNPKFGIFGGLLFQEYNMVGSGHKTIIVPDYYCNFISRTLGNDNDLRKLEIQKIASAIQHEGNHIKHKDLRNLAIVRACIPFITHLVLKGLYGSIIQRLYKFKPPKSKIRMLGRNIGAGLGKMQINGHFFGFISRGVEQRADDGVVDPGGMIDWVKEFYNRIPANAVWADMLHPHPLNRIKRLEERMKEAAAKKAENADAS